MATLPGLRRENLEMKSAFPTAFVTLSIVVLMRDMRVDWSPRTEVIKKVFSFSETWNVLVDSNGTFWEVSLH